jgi:glycosyltransferase involved in cell wall biosynthesis
MTARPTFGFVVPCFNEEDNVEPTVGSIRAAMQGRSDYEIILVNDASTDRTLERMQALAAGDSRIRSTIRATLVSAAPTSTAPASRQQLTS